MMLKKLTIFPLFELCTDMIWTSTFWTFMQTRVPFIVLISSTLSIIPVVKVGLGRFSLNRIISSKVIEYPNHSTPFFVHLIHKLWLLYVSKAYFISSTYYAPQPVILWRLWFENKVSKIKFWHFFSDGFRSFSWWDNKASLLWPWS